MNKEAVYTKNAPQALGPYSQAIKIKDLVYTSGQIGIDPFSGEIVSGGVKEQAKQCFENLSEVLKAAGTSLDSAVKTTVFVKSMDDFAALNEVYAGFFNEPYPARSCVEVSKLPKDVLCEIEIIALV